MTRSRSLDRFLREAEALGLTPEVRRFPEGTRTAEDAARAIGCHVGQIVKSLVFVAGTEPFLALTSGPNRADTDRLAALAGAPVRRADAEEARQATGYSIGGTPPFGHPRLLRAFCDRDLLGHPVVWAAAGTPDTVFPIAPDDLLRVSGAEPADFGR
ncbi:MAG TPA: YbaK/EbsC family protein [Actinomycetota bacterium]|nr:YbaK/EbsC family protein [Actinomycetota bacterium]